MGRWAREQREECEQNSMRERAAAPCGLAEQPPAQRHKHRTMQPMTPSEFTQQRRGARNRPASNVAKSATTRHSA